MNEAPIGTPTSPLYAPPQSRRARRRPVSVRTALAGALLLQPALPVQPAPEPAAPLPAAPVMWRALESLPMPVFDAAAAEAGEYLLVTGGFDADFTTTSVIQRLRDGRGWLPIGTRLQEPRARHRQVGFATGDFLVVGGVGGRLPAEGRAGDLRPLASAELIDPPVALTTRIDLSEPLEDLTLLPLDDLRAVVVGGSGVRLFDARRRGFTEWVALQRPRRGAAVVAVRNWIAPLPQTTLASAPVPTQTSLDSLRAAHWRSALADALPEVAPVAPLAAIPEPTPAASSSPFLDSLRAAPDDRPAPETLIGPGLLVIGGDDEGTIEFVSLERGISVLLDMRLPTPLREAGAAATPDGSVLLLGGFCPQRQVSVDETWRLTAPDRLTPGPALALPGGVAEPVVWMQRDRLYIIGGEQRSASGVRPTEGMRMIDVGNDRVWELRGANPQWIRRAWLHRSGGQPVGIAGYRFEAGGPVLSADLDWFRGAPTPGVD